jgi:iron complex transport system ATP-binding protein
MNGATALTPLMEARQVEFAYPGGARAIRISLTVEAATMTAVIGSNGSGKSTLIRLLAGLLRPTAGSILLEGKPLDDWQPRLRAREIAYMPQATSTVFPFRAIDVVLSGRTPHAPRFGFEGEHDHAIAMESLTAAGAAHLAERCVTALSGGEKQMVILARALAQEPRVLLLDEPAAALDLKHRAELMRTLARLRDDRGLSVVMITHDLQLTGSLFDRIVALRCGELAAQGPPQEILQAELLAAIYDDPKVRTTRVGDQTVVWVDR